MSNGAAILPETTGAFAFDFFIMEKVGTMEAGANFSPGELRDSLAPLSPLWLEFSHRTKRFKGKKRRMDESLDELDVVGTSSAVAGCCWPGRRWPVRHQDSARLFPHSVCFRAEANK